MSEVDCIRGDSYSLRSTWPDQKRTKRPSFICHEEIMVLLRANAKFHTSHFSPARQRLTIHSKKLATNFTRLTDGPVQQKFFTSMMSSSSESF